MQLVDRESNYAGKLHGKSEHTATSISRCCENGLIGISAKVAG